MITSKKKAKKRNVGLVQRFHRLHPLKGHPLAVPVATFFVLFFASFWAFLNINSQTYGASDSRVVHVSVDGERQVVPTRAVTVKELVERLDIELHEKDIVEPSLDTEIHEDNFKVNIYKARPVTIVDGDKSITTYSAESTPQRVAEEAGLKIYPEDKVEKQAEMINSDKILQEGLVVERVVVDRATPAYINLYGSSIPVRTRVMTVAQLLEEKNIKPLPDDVVTPGLDSPIADGTQVFIVRIGHQIDTKEEIIPMPEEIIYDASLPVGQRVVRQQGRPGRKLVTYEVELQNDREVSRRVIQEVIAVEPLGHTVVVGTKVIYSNPSQNVATGQQVASSMGWGHEFSCIYQIYQRESGWNHLARNRSSGAYGIPQALPGSKMATAGSDWETNPATQIRWGIGYMVNRYGSPCRAYNFWQMNHWY